MTICSMFLLVGGSWRIFSGRLTRFFKGLLTQGFKTDLKRDFKQCLMQLHQQRVRDIDRQLRNTYQNYPTNLLEASFDGSTTQKYFINHPGFCFERWVLGGTILFDPFKLSLRSTHSHTHTFLYLTILFRDHRESMVATEKETDRDV